MIEEFRKYIKDNNLLRKSDKILLAVSGGIDSMVMAHLFLSTHTRLAIAHCNFSLRGTESDDDEAFVRKFASKNNLPYYSQKFDTAGYASEKGISIQMAARELRYNWFEEIKRENRYKSISVAHNLNDNAETFLINLARGTGIAGLTGMKPKHDSIIRPLLFASRSSIIEYSKLNSINYREDRSNAETKYTRNKIRHAIIPLFSEINPSFESTIVETAGRMNEINDIITSHISYIRKMVENKKDDSIYFKIDILQDLSPKLTLLFELFRPYGIGKNQLGELVKLINGKTGSQLLTSGYRLIKNRKEVVVSKKEEDSGKVIKIKGVEDFIKYEGFISARIQDLLTGYKVDISSDIACLDSEKVSFPLIIRSWQYGDTFYPLGMKQKKKLSDYFVDRKYSVFEKEQCRILESEGKIVWIINDRIDDRFKITAETKKVLIIVAKSKNTDSQNSYLSP